MDAKLPKAADVVGGVRRRQIARQSQGGSAQKEEKGLQQPASIFPAGIKWSTGTGLQLSPTAVLVLTLVYMGGVMFLHIVSKFRVK